MQHFHKLNIPYGMQLQAHPNLVYYVVCGRPNLKQLRDWFLEMATEIDDEINRPPAPEPVAIPVVNRPYIPPSNTDISVQDKMKEILDGIRLREAEVEAFEKTLYQPPMEEIAPSVVKDLDESVETLNTGVPEFDCMKCRGKGESPNPCPLCNRLLAADGTTRV